MTNTIEQAIEHAIETGIATVCHILLWVSTSVIFVILVANTVLRYATGSSLQWANEVPELLFPWLVMAGVVLAALHGAHITTSFMVDKLQGRLRLAVGIAGWLTVSALYLTLAVATYRMLSIVHDEKSSILQIPGSVTYSCVMVGMALLALLALLSARRVWTQRHGVPTSDTPLAVHW
jgi:TRAP-type C4-dicarboxylate transport system permease small subunit